MLVSNGTVRLFLDKNSGDEGAGGDGEGDGVGVVEKKFTEAELKQRIEQSMIRHRKQLQKENREKEAQITSLTEKLTELQKQVEEKVVVTENGNGDPLAGQLKLMEQRNQREMEDLRRKLEVEQTARKQAEKDAAEQKRDSIINKALNDAGCNDQKVGYRYIAPDVYWDEVEDKWLVKTEIGGSAEINGDNVREILPPHLKQPLTNGRAGSGSQSGVGKLAQKVNELEAEKKKLTALMAIRGASDEEVMEMSKQRRKVAQLELDVQNARK